MSSSEEEPLDSSSSESDQSSLEGSKLFLGGISWQTSEEKLREHFQQYGEIIEVVVMKDRNTGRPRGFGFVTYKEPNIADQVVKDVHYIDGRQIDTKKSVPQESKPKARKIFVGGLSAETTEEEFKAYFATFGQIAEVQIMQDHMSGRSRGFGFITFEEDSSAQRVFEAGTMHELGGKRIEIKQATPKGTGPQASSRAPHLNLSASGGATVGRRSNEYDTSPTIIPQYANVAPGTPPYGAYGMFGYTNRPGTMMPPTAYAMQSLQYPTLQPQYMMIQPGYNTAPGVYGTYQPGPGTYNGGAPQGPGGSTGTVPPIPYTHSRPSPRHRQQYNHQQQQYHQPQPQQQLYGLYHSSSSQPYPGMQRNQKNDTTNYTTTSNNNRNKVDSASSLDQHAENLKKLSLD